MPDTHTTVVKIHVGDGVNDDRELEVHFEADIEPYRPATGPSYASGGEPPEGGYADLTGAYHHLPGKLLKCRLDWLLVVLPAKTLEAIAEKVYDDFMEKVTED